ncbi:MAG: hypothetical protein JSR39_04915 [Verrucomicrobia bacterium]|nr:hypothetical protein [Verrucomicrobiota bacterium]
MLSIEPLSVQYGSMDVAPHPIVFLNLIEIPQNFDLLAVLDYDVWANNVGDENEAEETLLELRPQNTPNFSHFPKTFSGRYYIIGYINGEDELHQLIRIPAHIDNISFRITQNLEDYQLHISPGVELLEDPE